MITLDEAKKYLDIAKALMDTAVEIYKALETAHSELAKASMPDVAAAAEKQADTLPTSLSADDAVAENSVDDRFPK
jgi:hypothetical protein